MATATSNSTTVADRSDFHERILQALRANLRAEEVLDRIVDTVTQHLKADGGFLFLKDRITGQLVLRSASVHEPHEFLHGKIGIVRLKDGEGLTGWALQNYETGVVNSNPRADPRFSYMSSLGEDDFNSALAVPIKLADEQAIGVFTLYSVDEGFFGNEPIKAAEEVVHILAGIIDRAELAAEDRRKAYVLTFLSDLAQSLNRETSVQEVLSDVVQKTCGVLNASYCMIAFLDEERRIIVQAGSEREEGKNEPSEESSRDSEVVCRELGIEANNDLELNDILKGSSGDWLTPYNEVISGPLNAGAQQIGVINCYRDYPFPREDQELLRTISAQAALSLKSALLVQNLKDVSPVWRLIKLLSNRHLLPEATALAATLGVELDKSHVLVRGRLTRAPRTKDIGTADIDAAMRRVETLIKSYHPGSLVYSDFGELTGIVPVRDDASVRRISKQLDEACQYITANHRILFTVGISAIVSSPHQYASALDEALEVLKIGAANLGHGHAFTYQQIALYIYTHRLASDPRSQFDPMRQKFLRLVRYDQQKRTQLVKTLREYLDNQGNSSKTCEQLNIHRNTLRQRLHRIEGLTGIDLDDKESWFAYQLGIQLAQLVYES